MSVFPPGLEPLEDTSAASWVEEALAAWPAGRFHVRDLVPPVFEAYGRILHVPYAGEGVAATTWAELASSREVPLEAETSYEELWGGPRGAPMWDERVPREGSLSEAEIARLYPLLERYSGSPNRCWFLLWVGWGFLREGGMSVLHAERDRRAERRARREERAAQHRDMRFTRRFAKVELLGRSGRIYFLSSGPIESISAFRFPRPMLSHYQSPNLWWPDDKAWFIHSEIDGHSTYLGGSHALVDELVGSQALESFEVDVDMTASG